MINMSKNFSFLFSIELEGDAFLNAPDSDYHPLIRDSQPLKSSFAYVFVQHT